MILGNSGCDPSTPDTGTEPVVGTVQVLVAGQFSGVAGVPVAINDSTGALVANGVTDMTGHYSKANVTEGGSITIGTESSGSKILQTRYNFKVDREYRFDVEQEGNQVGTVTVTAVGAPDTNVSITIGRCGGSPGTPIKITQNCLQSDGKVTVYATSFDTSRVVHGRAVAYDVAVGAVTPVTLNTWATPETTLTPSIVGAPGEIQEADLTLQLERKGIAYGLEATKYGTIDGNRYSGTQYRFPEQLPLPQNGHGFVFSGGFVTDGPDGYRIGQFFVRLADPSTNQNFSAMNRTPNVEIPVATVDGFAEGRPRFAWSVTGTEADLQSVDAVVGVIAWNNAAHYWIVTAPQEWGLAEWPRELPASLDPFLPPANGGVYAGPIMYAANASWTSGYDEFASQVDGSGMLLRGIPETPSEASLSYIAHMGSDIVLNKNTRRSRLRPLSLRELLSQ